MNIWFYCTFRLTESFKSQRQSFSNREMNTWTQERFRCYLNEEEEISLKQKLQESIRIFFEFSRRIHKKKEDKTRIGRVFLFDHSSRSLTSNWWASERSKKRKLMRSLWLWSTKQRNTYQFIFTISKARNILWALTMQNSTL